ncbi:hypothetical protein ACQZV8_11085 [Magnetococcales bacterium HHB-1]
MLKHVFASLLSVSIFYSSPASSENIRGETINMKFLKNRNKVIACNTGSNCITKCPGFEQDVTKDDINALIEGGMVEVSFPGKDSIISSVQCASSRSGVDVKNPGGLKEG